MPKEKIKKPLAKNKPQPDFEKEIMAKVRSEQLVMKPKWYFIAGSVLSLLGLIGLTMTAVFLTSLTMFSLRSHGMMAQWRMNVLLESFPWWLPFLAAGTAAAGIWLLRKYDFSYKQNFWLLVLAFVAAILFSGLVFDYLGVNEAWSHRGPMRGLYQHLQQGEGEPGPGRQMRRQRSL